MKDRVLLIVFVIIFSIASIFAGVTLYKKISQGHAVVEPKVENNVYEPQSENNIPKPEEKVNLISNVEPFLFTQKGVKLVYEGGPSHWGSKTITLDSIDTSDNSKIVNLHVVDESDLKGEDPKKEWNQKWEAKSDGSLYIDDVLMLKSPINVGQNWNVTNYKPVTGSDKKYTANIKITSIQNSLNDSNVEVKNITTTLTIADIKTVDGGLYTETRVFESGIGLKKFTVTEPTISDFTLSYWLDNTIKIK